VTLVGQWWQSRTNPAAILEIVAVAKDGGVKVAMDGKTINTSLRYLRNTFKPLDAATKGQDDDHN
jgi:hypothetical protein